MLEYLVGGFVAACFFFLGYYFDRSGTYRRGYKAGRADGIKHAVAEEWGEEPR